jgi:hypothetical protein
VAEILLRMRNVSDKSHIEKTHILCSVTLSENRVAYNIMWKNVVETDRPEIDNIIRRMRVAFWISKATDTHSEYVTLLFHCHNGWTKAPECWIVRTWRLSLNSNQRKTQVQHVIRFNMAEILPMFRKNLLTSADFHHQGRVISLDTDLQQSTKFVECYHSV